jgi:hypothetical protein
MLVINKLIKVLENGYIHRMCPFLVRRGSLLDGEEGASICTGVPDYGIILCSRNIANKGDNSLWERLLHLKM